MNKRVVIIGGGFGGLYAARQLGSAAADVALIDRRNHHLFQPLLYQVATGALSPADIASPLRGLLKAQKNTRVLLGDVVGFNTEQREVILRDGVVSYDVLVVAAGSGNHYFGNEQWQQNAPSLKTLEDATEIRRRILTAFERAERAATPEEAREWLTFAIIGGGPTGVELAGALAEMAYDTLQHDFRAINPADTRIILVQSGERVLPTYTPNLSEKAQIALQRLGVDVRTGGRVKDVTERGITIANGETTDVIPARTVLWAAGVQASPLGRALADAMGASIDRSGRIVVEPDLSVPGHPDIYVIGDLAHFAHQGDQPLPGVAQVAIQQGRYVGKSIAARLRGKTVKPFHYYDPGSVAMIGRGNAVAEIGRVKLTGWLAWNLWLVIHLFYNVELSKQVLVFVQWLWNFTTRGRTALLITNAQRAADAIRRTTQTLTLRAVESPSHRS